LRQFYTPQHISDILSAIVTLDSQEPKTGKKPKLDKVLDFACGSGSLLLNVRKKMGPNGIGKIFGQEKNITTGIPVCILVLKKCKKPDDVLFINAAEHFEKSKRQNRLTIEHIAKIIDTFQFRNEEERYSKRISMERIAEEGYNLNISRYISTATAEPEIDLAETHNKLVEVGG